MPKGYVSTHCCLKRVRCFTHISTHLLGHGLLLLAGVDGNDLQAHSLGVLLGKGTKTTTRTDDGDGLTWSCSRLFQTLVDGDTGAEDWGYLI